MKTIRAILLIAVSLLSSLFTANAQTGAAALQSIAPYPLSITYSKTTNIVFPQAIISVDRGSRDVLAQKAKGVENILQVKAARDSFPETNLSVVTADGRLNSFVVNYSAQPQALNLSLPATLPPGTIAFSSGKKNIAEIEGYAKAALHARASGKVARDKNSGIRFTVDGFFIHDDVLYCRVDIDNRTNIGYDIGQFRFFIRDQQKAKRTATQEIEVTPVHIENNAAAIKPQSGQTIVFALPKFTIPDKKYLAVQLVENNGGRHLEVHIKDKAIVRAAMLP